jgi:CRISPR-associated endonuclease/helicase Cas3
MNESEFRIIFEKLTGNVPLRWQERLFHNHFATNDIPRVIDLPTGLGKTMVMAIWLIAHEVNKTLPRRLVYVVDRRTVVDQATDLATSLKNNISSALPTLANLTVSTLRGQLADNREWTRDPSRPAIIIGTVDMIGSRLLFSGYRSSYKQRPLDAGLLGQDSLLVLDEAHLSEPFAKLIDDIERFQGKQGSPMRVIKMSATTSGDDASRFKLEPTDLGGDRESNPIVRRFNAEKRLRITPVERKDMLTEIVKVAAQLANDNSRVVVFVRSPDEATRIAEAVRKHGDKKSKSFAEAVEVLTGTMRGLERDELLEKPVMKRFLNPDNRPNEGPAILVSTSAGEVGFDLNADHLVCDAAPLDSMIQRLGRVNRRGNGSANVHVFAPQPEEKTSKKKDEARQTIPEHTIESAAAGAMLCLSNLTEHADGTYDASPRAIAGLKEILTARQNPPPGSDLSPVEIADLMEHMTAKQIQEASSPKPTTVELTDILLDAWSLTSITETMPGRPPVAFWLRGINADLPQTTIAWRAELDLDGFDQLDTDDIEEWFDAHRILPHEMLTVPTSIAQEFLEAVRDANPSGLPDATVVIERSALQATSLSVLLKNLQRNDRRLPFSTLILPASVGGVVRKTGLLDPDFIFISMDSAGNGTVREGEVVPSPDVADERGRQRRVKTTGIDTNDIKPLLGSAPDESCDFACFTLDLPSNGDVRRQLISLVPKRERLESGTARQALSTHVGLVQQHVARIADGLRLSASVRQALGLAAARHDNGKGREAWQRAVGRNVREEPIGKSGGSMERIRGNYRHEFGSLREFIDTHEGKIPADVFDLTMHLIATHHGRGRPHFPKGGFDPDARSNSPQIATDSIRRFAKLQRTYGYWYLAWLENLLRCSDALASAENEEGGSK